MSDFHTTSPRRTRRFPIRRLLMALMVLCSISGTAANPNSVEESHSARVDQVFNAFTRGVQPGAAVMVIRAGEIVHSKGYGYANLAAAEPITPDSTFRLGSVSKQFTAMAIALLAERGLLDLDAPAAAYVPAIKNYDGVTVRHLLVHTSGLPDYYDEIDTAEWELAGSLPNNQDVIDYVGAMNAPQFAPGEKYVYSNPAYEVLPLVVEHASGKPFSRFMVEDLFTPLGMDNSLIHDHHRPHINHRVLGYSKTDDGYELNDENVLNGITGSGGQYSTLEDFYAWDQALYGNEFLSEALLESVFTRAILNSGEAIDYGFGWRLDEYRGHRRIAHGGSWVGFNTAISRFPDLGLSIVILSNRAEYDPVAVSDQVADIYLD